jgi:hypothetical protein
VLYNIVIFSNYNSNEVISECNKALIEYFDISRWNINDPILIKEIIILLDKISGVQTVDKISIKNKTGDGYSSYSYDIDSAIKNNIIYPSLDPMIFEVKYPNTDIKGSSINI